MTPSRCRSTSCTPSFSLPSIYLRSRRRSAANCIRNRSLSLRNSTEATDERKAARKSTPVSFNLPYCNSPKAKSTWAEVLAEEKSKPWPCAISLAERV